jgi:predicted nuclease of predicted toxin-antitoxin system
VRNAPDRSVAEYVFFIDRSLGSIVVPEALQQAGVHVEIHASHFVDNTPDTDWLAYVGQQGWIVLMKDKHIRSRSHERQALIYAGVRAFVLVAGNISGHEMGASFVKALPAMYDLLTQRDNPFIAQITRQGRISAIHPRAPH